MKYRIINAEISGIHNISDAEKYTFSSNESLISGKNGSGKSTILQAVQWALLGYIPGTAKKAGAIWEHHNPASTFMEVCLTLENTSTNGKVKVYRYLAPDKSSWENKFTVNDSDGIITDEDSVRLLLGDLELPIFNFSQFLNMSQNQIKDWFLKFLPSKDAELDLEEILKSSTFYKAMFDTDKEELDAEISKYVKMLSVASSLIEGVQSINTDIKGQIKYLKGEHFRVVSTLQSLVKYDTEEIRDSEELLQEISKTKQDLSVLKASLIKIRDGIKVNSELQEFKNENGYIISQDIKKHSLNLQDLKLKIATLKSERQGYSDKLISIQNQILGCKKVIEGNGICPFTNSVCESIKDLINKTEEELSDLEKQQFELSSSINSITNTIDSLEVQVFKIVALIKEHEEVTFKLNLLESKSDPSNTLPKYQKVESKVVEIEQSLEDLNSELIKVTANESYSKLYDQLSSDSLKLSSKIDLYKDWDKITGMNGIQSSLSEGPFKVLMANMDSYIKDVFGEVASSHFVLSEKANSFSFGIKKGETYIPYNLLSSGEKCMYAFILFICMVQTSNSRLPLVLVDDMLDNLDNSNTVNMLNLLDSVSSKLGEDIQIIVAGVIKNIQTEDAVQIIAKGVKYER